MSFPYFSGDAPGIRNLDPHPPLFFTERPRDERRPLSLQESCALLTPAVGTSVEILRFAQDDTKKLMSF
jgi:hypothetical protein